MDRILIKSTLIYCYVCNLLESYANTFLPIKIQMGNQNTSINHSKRLSINHPVLSQANLLSIEGTSQAQLMLVGYNSVMVENWKLDVQKYRVPMLDNQQIIFLPIKVFQYQQSLCGSSYFLKAYYRPPPLLLIEEVQNRAISMESFSEQEILYTLYILACAAQQVRSRGLILGDIRPRNIFLFEDGTLRVGCLASFPDQTSNYIKSLTGNIRTYLAPEQLDELQNNKKQIKQAERETNQEYSEDFSIGMTILGLILLHDEQKLYLTEFGVFDSQKFQIELESLCGCKIYSPFLRKLVLGLLQKLPEQRLSAVQIFRMLQPYQKQILQLQTIKIISNSQIITRINNYNFNHKKFIPFYHHHTGTQDGTTDNAYFHEKDSKYYERGQKSLTIIDALNADQRLISMTQSKIKQSSPSIIIHYKNQNKQSKTPENRNKFVESVDKISRKTFSEHIVGENIIKASEFEGKYNYFPTSSVVLPDNLQKKNMNKFKNDPNRISFNNGSPIQGVRVNFDNIQKMQMLESFGRDAKSIRGPDQGKYRKAQYQHEPSREYNMENVFKDIDEQIQRSRKLHPN